MDWTALGLSFRLAAWTTLILAAIGLPLAYWLAFTRWRGRHLIDTVVAMPLVLPPTVLGFWLLYIFSPLGKIGGAYTALTGRTLAFSFEGLLVASVLYSLPFAVQPFKSAFVRVDRRLLEASWCLGVSKPRTFLRILLPLSAPGIAAGMILAFAHTLGEFGVVLMVGGNIPGVTRTISISIYDNVQALDYQAATWNATILLVISFVILGITSLLRSRNERRV